MKNKLLLITYLIVSLLLFSEFVLACYGYSYAGYWTEKIIRWAWLVSTLIIIISFWHKKLARMYLSVLIILIILSILPMGLLFVGLIFDFSTAGDYQQFTLNDTYRIENTQAGALAGQRIYIFQNHGLLETNVARPDMHDIYTQMFEDEFRRGVMIENAKFVSVDDQEIRIKYTINGKTATISHKLHAEDGY